MSALSLARPRPSSSSLCQLLSLTSTSSAHSSQPSSSRCPASAIPATTQCRNQFQPPPPLLRASSPFITSPNPSEATTRSYHAATPTAGIGSDIHDPHSLTIGISQSQGLPLFRASSDQLELLQSPSQFYNTLKERILSARKRIFISSLYIGKEEKPLIQALRKSLSRRPELRLVILTDALRSTREARPKPSTASLLANLERDFPDQVHLRLYHTPKLKGLVKRLVGRRFNEGWGLQHMKIYGFDDDVIMSGANLSNDYFTNRMDRYMLIRSHAKLADYLDSLVLLVSRFSYRLVHKEASMDRPKEVEEKVVGRKDDSAASEEERGDQDFDHLDYELVWDGGERILKVGDSSRSGVDGDGWPRTTTTPLANQLFVSEGWESDSRRALEELTRFWKSECQGSAKERSKQGVEEDTLIVPLLQMGPLQIRQETEAVPKILRMASSVPVRQGDEEVGSKPKPTLDLTSGYLSLYPPYRRILTSPTRREGEAEECLEPLIRILCASPRANGFFGSKGVSGWIPQGYTLLEKRFWQDLRSNRRLAPPPSSPSPNPSGPSEKGRSGVEIREWFKEGWTYHAKGIWLSPPPKSDSDRARPTVTHIGSSNYGSRSSDLDLECTLLISTESASLSERLGDEVERLRKDATQLVDQQLFQSRERKVSWKVYLAVWLVGHML
ncbi:hypothetical protein IE53DRAFT_389472 [Violaceomyces palustris]|uniref:Uncharacterized protein n=1 Tax=Violaceomyces palustris TaxID=1673888 RepID=A0ACD0NR56_9BASI|nr:hypothetical protein IE53DRAFT_389472 [Violaceomyces palustris]